MQEKDVLIIYTNGFQFSEEQIRKVRTDFTQFNVTDVDETEVTDEMLERAEVIVGFVKEEMIRKAKKLKWLHLSSVGVDKHIDKNMYCNKDILLTNSSGVYGESISDHIMGYMIMLARNLHFYRDNQSRAQWIKINPKKDLFKSTVGIIGLGDVGSELAKKAKAFGMRVLAVKRNMTSKPDYVDELYTAEMIECVLDQADFVVLSLAATPETINIMNRERLSMMKRDAYLINIGRGSLIDQEALYDALKNNKIAGAAIDVTTPEPLPEDNPLWELKNLIVTPHVSGKSLSTSERQFSIFYDELSRYSRGETLQNTVDFDLKY